MYRPLVQPAPNFANRNKKMTTMGIDLSGIIKNDFRERKHRRACEDYVNATINLLTDKYHISNDTFRLE